MTWNSPEKFGIDFALVMKRSWVKFEEDVEEGGSRWSKPHVATLSLHSLFELRSLLLNGPVLLDADAQTLVQITDLSIDMMANSGHLPFNSKDRVTKTRHTLMTWWDSIYKQLNERFAKLFLDDIVISTRRTKRTVLLSCPLFDRWQILDAIILHREVSTFVSISTTINYKDAQVSFWSRARLVFSLFVILKYL